MEKQQEPVGSETIASFPKEVQKSRIPTSCPMCKGTVTLATFPYTAKLTRGGKPVEVHMEKFTSPKCTKCGEILFTRDSDDQITAAMREHLTSSS